MEHTTVTIGGDDDPPVVSDDTDEDTDTSSGGGDSDGDGDSTPPEFRPLFNITLGHVLVTDEETGDPLVQWKAKCEGETAISDDPMAAVMGVVEVPMKSGATYDYGVTD